MTSNRHVAQFRSEAQLIRAPAHIEVVPDTKSKLPSEVDDVLSCLATYGRVEPVEEVPTGDAGSAPQVSILASQCLHELSY